ncbi:response regulator [Kribbella sp. CWNU-51]
MADERAAPPVRVLLADDEALVRDGLQMLLDNEPGIEVVGSASDGAEAIDLAARLQPDVVLLDVRMPVLDGVEATRAMVADSFSPGNQTVRVLILSSYHDDDAVYGALRSGASGFLLKSAVRRDLVSALRTVAAGGAWLDPVVAHRLIGEFASRPNPALPTPEEMASLTDRERDVLVLLAHGLGTTEISGHLVIGETTTKTHIGRILMKLGLRSRTQAVAAAYKTGLVKPGDSPPGTSVDLGGTRP